MLPSPFTSLPELLLVYPDLLPSSVHPLFCLAVITGPLPDLAGGCSGLASGYRILEGAKQGPGRAESSSQSTKHTTNCKLLSDLENRFCCVCTFNTGVLWMVLVFTVFVWQPASAKQLVQSKCTLESREPGFTIQTHRRETTTTTIHNSNDILKRPRYV